MSLSQAPKHSQPQTVATSACPKREIERPSPHAPHFAPKGHGKLLQVKGDTQLVAVVGGMQH